MNGMWNLLEERTRTWKALERQGLADAIWADYIPLRFGRTGDPRALDYLYPYLNHFDKRVRLRALAVAARVFEGRGPRAIDALDYFTRNPDLFLRDRAVQVVSAAVKGSRDEVVLEVLAPYLNHRNQYIRKLALVGLGQASVGQASPQVLAEIQRTGRTPGPRRDEVDLAIARAFAGRPTEEVYTLIAPADLIDDWDPGEPIAVAVLVRGASDAWYERACEEVFEPRLHAGTELGWKQHFIRRDAVEALCHAAAGRGIEPLRRMLHLRHNRCTGHAMMQSVQECFAGADPEAHLGPTIELARKGDAQTQRVTAPSLGRMMMGAEDDAAIGVLRELCSAGNRAVQSAALVGLGMAARSTCDETLRQLCLERALEGETATAAIRALGMVFLASGRDDVFEDIRVKAEHYRARPVQGKKHCKPLAACYLATGLVYLGTGSTTPVEWLLDVLARPPAPRRDVYRWSAAKSLVMIEFAESKLSSVLATVLH